MYRKNEKLKSLELYGEEYNGYLHRFLKGVWEYETEYGRYELEIPKIDIGSFLFKVPNYNSEIAFMCVPRHYISLPADELELIPDEKGNVAYTKELEKFERKMTLEEIEKKLGYKINLVSRKED